jgi:hypothetical protein
MSDFKDRIIGAARLDAKIYEEVESDKTAMGQAVGVILLSSIAAGIGVVTKGGFAAIFSSAVGALLGWLIWAYITYVIGTKVLPESGTHADYGQLLRTIGFSTSPGLIRILGIIPGLTNIVFMIAAIWMLVAMVVAVRQALDYTTTIRAVCVCIIGWIVQALIFVVLFGLIGRGMPAA